MRRAGEALAYGDGDAGGTPVGVQAVRRSAQAYPPPEGQGKAEFVAALFGRVAPRYDLLNNITTGWQHLGWRRRTLNALGPLPPRAAALDLCCGTGDFLLLLAERIGPGGRLVGVDFCRPMLDLAGARLAAAGAAGDIRLLEADVTRLGMLADESFDVATVGFGLRNVANLEAALKETFRLLRPGGVLASLEMSWPDPGPIRTLALAYLRWVLPAAAWLAGARPEDYRWLRRSLEDFPDAGDLAGRLRGVGFARVEVLRFGFGLVAAHLARKAAS